MKENESNSANQSPTQNPNNLNGIKHEKIKMECEQWIRSTAFEQIPVRQRLVNKYIIYHISEITEDEIILLDDPLIREIDCQILEALEIKSRVEEEIEELQKESNNFTKKLGTLNEIKMYIIAKKFRITPTTISFPFALVENRRQFKELLIKIILNLREAPIVQLELVKMLSSLAVLPRFQEILEKCQIPERFGLDIVNEILIDRDNFFRIIEEIINDENRCYVISSTNPDKYNSCYIEYARLLNALNKSSAS
jgi:hypothetical protein